GEQFQFATLQSPAGRAQLARLNLPETDLKTVVLVEAGRPHVRPTATLRGCRRLARVWALPFGFPVLPETLRRAVYALIARKRKLWFRPPEACPVMPPEWRRRFVG